MRDGQDGSATPAVDAELLEATAAAITRWGLSETTLERVATEAGMSRATIYRRGVTREQLVAALTEQAGLRFQAALFPALVGTGSAADRMQVALAAVCQAADENLQLLAGMFLAHDEGFHTTGPDSMVVDLFADPFERLLRDGELDGTLRSTDPTTTATVLFNMVGWGYVHLRASHHWDAEQARTLVLDLALRGLVVPSGAPDAP